MMLRHQSVLPPMLDSDPDREVTDLPDPTLQLGNGEALWRSSTRSTRANS